MSCVERYNTLCLLIQHPETSTQLNETNDHILSFFLTRFYSLLFRVYVPLYIWFRSYQTTTKDHRMRYVASLPQGGATVKRFASKGVHPKFFVSSLCLRNIQSSMFKCIGIVIKKEFIHHLQYFSPATTILNYPSN